MKRDSAARLDAYEAVFNALAHPARRRVLLTLHFHRGSMTAGEIAGVFAHAWQTTTRHLQVLEAAGLLTHEKQGRKRIYRIEVRRLELVRDWLAWFSESREARSDDGGRTNKGGQMPAKKKAPAQKVTSKAKHSGAADPVRRPSAARARRKRASGDVPQFFRLSVEVGSLEAGVEFYRRLLAMEGRKQAGSRCYFECGPVTLSVLDVSAAGRPHPAAKALYFTVKDLDAAFERARELGCLSRENVHDAPGGGIVVRPWGERSFYVEDPWKNPLCFVEDGTVYTG